MHMGLGPVHARIVDARRHFPGARAVGGVGLDHQPAPLLLRQCQRGLQGFGHADVAEIHHHSVIGDLDGHEDVRLLRQFTPCDQIRPRIAARLRKLAVQAPLQKRCAVVVPRAQHRRRQGGGIDRIHGRPRAPARRVEHEYGAEVLLHEEPGRGLLAVELAI